MPNISEIKIGNTIYNLKDTALKSIMDSQTLTWQRYLTSSDDATSLTMGVYGISSLAQNQPSNLPSTYPANTSGVLIALERAFNVNASRTYFCFGNTKNRLWCNCGYGWLEISTDEYVQKQIDEVCNYFYNYFVPDFVNVSQDCHVKNTAIVTTNTQFRFLGENGIHTVGDAYTDWYIADDITVSPLTFYYLTGSAQYNAHDIFQILDENDNIIYKETISSGSVISYHEKLIYTPKGAAKMRIASVTGSSGIALYTSTEKTASQKWAGKKWVCIGDSLTAVNDKTAISYHDYIAEKTGITVVNLGKGGIGYKSEFDGEGPFSNEVPNIPLDADVVTIFGSGNDGSYTIGNPTDTGTTTLCGCINTTIAAVFNRMTTCQLGIVTPAPWKVYNTNDDTNWMAKYSEAIVEICKRWGIPCLDLYHCSNLRPWEAAFRAAAYSNDGDNGVHPDETGHKLIASRFEGFLNDMILS